MTDDLNDMNIDLTLPRVPVLTPTSVSEVDR